MGSRNGWIKRRARRLQAFFHVDRSTAVISAHQDWKAFKGIVTADRAPRTCDSLGVCQLHAAGRQGCDACPYRNIPRAAPPFAPGVIEGPHWPRKGWRAALAALGRWLAGPTPW